MLIVLVKFKVGFQDYALFKQKLRVNAQASLREPTCHRFDLAEVCLPDTQEYEFVLYEEYSDEPAFDFHLTTAHFHNFNADTAFMVHSKEITLYQSID